ncbi:MAG TPA: ABC transporter substrate-binding protein [Reyranella sp.]|nr:ABC transporter substrate-binding protein [Reyranella sp.]
MQRRSVLAALGAAVVSSPRVLLAQRMPRVAFVLPAAAPTDKTPLGHSLLQGLAKVGFVEGRNLAFEPRGAEGHLDRLPAIMAELTAAKVDVIMTSSYPCALAAKDGTTLPVVAINCGDPVATGLVPSLAHPGGHVTGVSDVSAELTPKRMDLLRAVSPNLNRVGILWNDGDHGMQLRAQASEAGAKSMSIDVEKLGIHTAGDFDRVFGELTSEKPGGLLVVADMLTMGNTKRIFEYVMAQKLPTIYEMDFLAVAGGLMSYGPDPDETSERAAALVGRILKGASPADLPFEQPTRFKLVVNLKTAKALGLTVPPRVLAAADQVIE